MDKNDVKKDHQSIYEKHQEMMSMFYVIENETIPNLEKEEQETIAKIKQMKTCTEEYYDLRDKVKMIKKEIKTLKKKKKDYLLEN